jgi:S-DNA-T family DNA segregation ATPase FtsK/SpoIIIE
VGTAEIPEIPVAAPPELPRPATPSLLVRLLPVGVSVVTAGAMAAAFFSGPGLGRGPTLLAFPVLMLASVAVTAVAGRGRGTGIDADRADYLGYLSCLRTTVSETAAAQRLSLMRAHPEPDALWTLIGGPRMWELRPGDAGFCVVRVGIGTVPLATRLVAPESRPPERSDPITVAALDQFLRSHSRIADAPVAIPLRPGLGLRIDGDPAVVRGLLRAMICQLAVLHAPDELLIVGVLGDRQRADWDWLKWLPHNQHPSSGDAVGSARLVYASMAEAQNALGGVRRPRVVVVVDGVERAVAGAEGMTTVAVGTGGDGSPLLIGDPGDVEGLRQPDLMDTADAVACARRLAAQRVAHGDREPGWADLVGIGDVSAFDPVAWWRGEHSPDGHDRLRVPIGTTVDGTWVELDIKEAAANGMGPHGLCVGATGSGKSELLRTVALGMMARNSPEVLNLLLVDFKGGATFLDFASAPHVAAVITNLSDEAALVARMRDALAGEMNRRQRLLRTAGNFVSVAAYESARRSGTQLAALPTLFIIVDEFSELLSQHPDFADTFVAIGRLGRSLGMHLLLASQRLDEGRLRGLDAHLSYRMCLKTLSASESRMVLGTLDAYQLPNTPGAGLLRLGTGEPIRFRGALVSGPVRTGAAVPAQARPTVRLFTSRPAGPVTSSAGGDGTPAGSVLQAVLHRMSGQGPPAHRVWLPPLGAAPALDSLLPLVPEGEGEPGLTVPIGIVDRPFEQSRTPLMVELSGAAGNVAIVGAPRSGKSTALRTLITALAATHDAARVQFYCLDFGGGALASVRTLPQVGAVAGRAEPQLVARMIAELESVVRSREARPTSATGGAGCADVFLVVDGWASLRHEFGELEGPITALAIQGLSFKVHVVLSASRWADIRPALKNQIGTRIELRLGDPADSEIDRRQAQQVPLDRPGRGLDREGLHMMIALPIDPIDPIDTDGRGPRGHGEPVAAAPPIPLLPDRVDYETVVHRAGDGPVGGILLGVEERRLRPAAVDFERRSHLLVLGDNECGKTAALRTLCRDIIRTRTAAQAQLLIVDFRRALFDIAESEHVGGHAMSPAALDALLPGLLALLRRRMPPPQASRAQLRARSWWSGPDIYVVVDDYDLVANAAGNPLAPLLEYLPHATDVGLHLIVARRSGGAARALFEPLLAGLRDLGCMELLMSGYPDDAAGFCLGRAAPLPPGRGVLITRPGDEQVVQVAWSPP